MSSVITITLNPCVDQVGYVDRVEADRKLRLERMSREPGGGGINVARAITELGGQARAIYPAGGPTGQMLQHLLDAGRIDHQAVPIDGWTRENPNIIETATRDAYRFITPGGALGRHVIDACLDSIGRMEAGSFLVLSGSLPPEVPASTYAEMAAAAHERGVRVHLDTSRDALAQTLGPAVFLIKPNRRELQDLVGRNLATDEEVRLAGRQIVEREQARVVLVSLGGDGAMLVSQEHELRLPGVEAEAQSRIGAGDSMMAGVTYALAQGWDLPAACRMGVAAGTAAVLTPGVELCRREDAQRIFEQVAVEAA